MQHLAYPEKGLTLVELLIVIAIMGVVFAGIYNTFQAQEKAYVLQDRVAEMNQNARIALEFMSRDIRGAACDPRKMLWHPGADAGIKKATEDTIVFTQDVRTSPNCTPGSGSDGQISCSGEQVGYRLRNNRIERCSGSSNSDNCSIWQPFVDRVSQLRFRYIYANGNSSDVVGLPNDAVEGQTFQDIREIQMAVTSERRPGFATAFSSRTLTSKVQVRNLALNRAVSR